MDWIAVFVAGNAVSMVVNLGFYAWGDHLPSSLAVGIVNGIVMLALMVIRERA